MSSELSMTLVSPFTSTSRRRWLWSAVAAILLLGLSSYAHAESPWVLQAGVGLGVHRTHADYPDAPAAGFSLGPGIQIDAGYRVHPIAAVGFHLGAQVIEAPKHLALNSFEDRTYVGIEAGLSGSVVFDRVTVTPWFGLQSLHSKRYRAGGLIGAYDVRTFGHESIALFASVIANRGWPISDIGGLLGVGYRYW
jgi:hypothetical protein